MSNSNHAAEMQACTEITKKLLKLPGAALFSKPVNTNNPEFKDYTKLVRNPQDLGTILKKLENNEYQNPQQWEKDVALVWSNAETYNGKGTYPALIAQHMSKQCEKLKKTLIMCKISGWMKNLFIWRDKLDKLLVSPPRGSTIRIFPEIEYKPPKYDKFTPKEMESFIIASRQMTRPDDVKCIAKILDLHPNNADEDDTVVLNIDNLQPRTLHALRDFFMKRYAEMNEPYPV